MDGKAGKEWFLMSGRFLIFEEFDQQAFAFVKIVFGSYFDRGWFHSNLFSCNQAHYIVTFVFKLTLGTNFSSPHTIDYSIYVLHIFVIVYHYLLYSFVEIGLKEGL